MTDGMYDQVMQIVRKQFALLDQDGEMVVNPAVVAAHVYAELDAAAISPTLVQYTSVLELRQLARSVCRKKYEDDDSAAVQVEMFDGALQPKYPAERNGERVYVPRAQMTVDEYNFNITRLRTEAMAKAKHADALQAERDERERLGHFAQSA